VLPEAASEIRQMHRRRPPKFSKATMSTTACERFNVTTRHVRRPSWTDHIALRPGHSIHLVASFGGAWGFRRSSALHQKEDRGSYRYHTARLDIRIQMLGDAEHPKPWLDPAGTVLSISAGTADDPGPLQPLVTAEQARIFCGIRPALPGVVMIVSATFRALENT
jgi:hypothetical protein